MKVGFIGLGAMGQGMACNLAAAGFLTAVYNRTQDKAAKFAEEFNVKACESIQQLSEMVEIVISCVSADNDVNDVVNAVAGSIRPGSIMIDMSTINSEMACKVALDLKQVQVDFLDAPVSGGVEGAKKGSLVIMVGGDSSVLDRVQPVLEAMSSRIVHVGDVGAGQGLKAVNQVMAAGINQAVTEALAFAESQNLDMSKVVEVISAGAAGNWFLQHRGLTMTQGRFDPGFKVALHHKDLKICQKMAENNAVDLKLLDMTLNDYEQLINQECGEEDISALYRLKK